ncbi:MULTISPECIES: ethanolamine ammonia-lyase subunit EutC [unclassified Rhizobium]|uniref:ethanolamine ammonia-lyase subunit EutC n=1 Tax=unclassified Rhizobium TaxID=2613769 RepID=UPI001ADB1698|nr:MULTISPECIES: ethanolamine ammonia-lyase subunit EutC [unclassified Rhizobium]MBO9096686.1 ethanolamine ammonia-lyase subunit EutC [Rhizobium sp. L58/93]MBO9134441.1 ethanolamine ammonia-lyase subunit EutC [Rhizobium sp. B209b/85]MBO9166941.1 ethanolamine ammonia-lyase subunit EutC [Rhizobium sp. L245/93]MBO9182913.1 ethanolamine ammonia-lyase subunit EutC [Rhizobium sp. E27B/91]QXZ83287.1 ethanolamine ammonia-lyase subunit EutC [Rhizobium sp. K1/93]
MSNGDIPAGRRASLANTDGWTGLKSHTTARIALGRAGASLPTSEVLNFGLAHAQAKDAVHLAFDAAAIAAIVKSMGLEPLLVESAAPSRESYLRRPDLGRRLADESRARLFADRQEGADIGIVIGDGLSATAIHRNVEPLLRALTPILRVKHLAVSPVTIARNARVALADEVGVALGVRCVLMLIGERPGLSSPDSIGAYLTFDPRVGKNDADRNCVSNIRPGGLSFGEAAHKLVWLIEEAFRVQATGVQLKDNSPTFVLLG